MLNVAILYMIGTYVADVLLRPADAARRARAAADARGKPLLNVGAGTPGSSLRVALVGPTQWGDVNVDIAGSGACTRENVCYADAHALPFADKQFGAVIASHVLEHVDDPARALSELRRVADEVFVICPRWWAPHTWLHPGHRWYLHRDGTFTSLWR
jgi:ubiquinone/menaquinone biosynthesis C-methylase UbiE